MKILLSNDDGIGASGLEIIYRELKKLGDVWMVAPNDEKSTTGHSITLHKPLRIKELGHRIYSVSGSPADCIYLGIKTILGKKPDLVVSGINRGANLGQDIYYSGTVSVAREAAMHGVPALAVSLVVDFKKKVDESKLHYSSASRTALHILKKIDCKKMPLDTLLNLNVPDLPFTKIRGIKIAKQGFRIYSGKVLERKDHRKRNYYWVGGTHAGYRHENGTDCKAVGAGYAALTPMKLDTTDPNYFKTLTEEWPAMK